MALKEVVYQGHSFPISYELVNPSAGKDLLFLHGWGSRKEFMKQAFGQYLRGYRHVYLDLPGFGKSPSDHVLDTADYAAIVEAFCREAGVKKEAVVGHSFGGKVGVLLRPETLVLLSSAGIPKKKRLSVRLKIALFKLLKPLGGRKLVRLFATKDVAGMAPNMYETLKKVVDEDFSGVFASYQGKALIFWGEEDDATPLESGRRIAELIPGASFFPLSGDHFFFLGHGREIAAKMEEFFK